jgi:phosphoglycerate kinase
MALKFLPDFDFQGKKVIARFDFNVPLEKGVIKDSTRIDSALPTINYLLEHGVKKLILMSHLGRPKGPEAKSSLLPIATYLAEKLKQEVVLTESCLDAGIRTLLELPQNKIILLENLRFHPEEEANDPEFAKKLASYADIYVNDAFGAAHRKHASTYEINRYFRFKAACGFLLQKEALALSKIVDRPQTPFVALMGGAKVSDKIKIIDSLLPKVQRLIIGGAMAYPFLKAKGENVGKSLCSDEDVVLAGKVLKGNLAEKILLPIDHVIAENPDSKAIVSTTIPDGLMGLDIGPSSIDLFKRELATAKTVLWNGPMGFFEKEAFATGTMSMAKTLAELTHAFTLVGGGDSVRAINESGCADKVSHVSTGGGASLEFIENGSLPGIDALKFGLS